MRWLVMLLVVLVIASVSLYGLHFLNTMDRPSKYDPMWQEIEDINARRCVELDETHADWRAGRLTTEQRQAKGDNILKDAFEEIKAVRRRYGR